MRRNFAGRHRQISLRAALACDCCSTLPANDSRRRMDPCLGFRTSLHADSNHLAQPSITGLSIETQRFGRAHRKPAPAHTQSGIVGNREFDLSHPHTETRDQKLMNCILGTQRASTTILPLQSRTSSLSSSSDRRRLSLSQSSASALRLAGRVSAGESHE